MKKQRSILMIGLVVASLGAGSKLVQASQRSEQGTATIAGKQVVLTPPIKQGREEVAKTQAPKEALKLTRAASSQSSVGMYRLYNPYSGEHFYTENAVEKDQVRAAGWAYEGISWQAPTTGDPVYRLYNPNAGDHHYTMNSYERANLKNQGWRDEGIAFYSDPDQTIPIYRAYNPNAIAGSHNYSPNSGEERNLVTAGWQDEGIAWYGSSVDIAESSNEDYTLLDVRNYDQYALGAPSGCEGAALLQGLQYKGRLADWGLTQFLNAIPKSSNGDPNNGFVGSPFVENGWTYSAIYPAPLTSWGQQYGDVQNISGSSMTDLIDQVKHGNPVVTWVTINFQPVQWGNWNFGVAANNNHAVTLDGYNLPGNQVHVSDSIAGSYWLNKSTFETIYNARKYAVVVK